MGYTLSDYNIPLSDLNETILATTVSRAKHEHEQLRQQLQRIYELVCRARSEGDNEKLNASIRLMNEAVRKFLSGWQSHNRWERSELFPYVSCYLGLEPDLFASIDKEYGLADKYMNTYLAIASESQKQVQPEVVQRMTSYLLQAYAVLLNRLAEEEDILIAATDRSNKYDY